MAETGHYKVLIIGAGTAGISMAARLRKHLSEGQIALIDPATKHYYQPLWTLVGGGICSREESEREMEGLIPDGVNWIQDAVEAFQPENNTLTTKKGDTIGYDALIVAPGIQLNWGDIKGLKESLGKNGVTSNYSYDIVEKTWQFIQEVQSGNAIFTFPNTAIKCAGAPQKIMWLAEESFRKMGKRDQINVIYAPSGAGIFGVPRYARALNKLAKERNIDGHYNRNLIEIRADKKEAVFEVLKDKVPTGETETLSYSMIHVTPPQSAPDFVRKSVLADKDGWVDVDKNTMQHKKFPNVFSLGDASSLPCSKTGAAVRKQAPVLEQNILAFFEDKALPASYDGYASCPLVTGYNSVILAEFGYDGKIMETFPFEQDRERFSMYALKRYALPQLYWHGMLKGRA
ncbi:MAG: NAD(P)/FAD-dependent oxidoreductase [Myxococcales bacterium]|nr:NAD(P)/FAD-dependent oxidoreductase [Myxococcales bacterium]